jgi:hypothetical protein
MGFGHSIQRVSGSDTKGQPIDLTVRVTDVYRKINGNWLIVHTNMSRWPSISPRASQTCPRSRKQLPELVSEVDASGKVGVPMATEKPG